ncbi:MAG TPA: dipeptidase PepE [Ramlibacter sp.]|nr:dipeptidase PepE [Ramlibacter sp.]
MNLLLLSNSTSEGGYLQYALQGIGAWAGQRRRAVFVPFAGVTRDWDDYARIVQEALAPTGIEVAPVHRAADAARAIAEAELLMVGGGNSFHLLHHCRRLGLLEPLREAVKAGTPYLGWSAGSNLACPTICTTNDMPVIDPGGLDALGLIPFQINPHYTNALPPGIRGETRNQRLAEFTRVRPEMPVLGLPEGNWLRISGARAELHGPQPAWWFLGSQEPRPLNAGPLDTAGV